MAFVAINQDIEGQGVFDVGSVANMLFFAVHLDTLGNEVRNPDNRDDDRILNAGWVTAGDHFDIGDGVDRNYWREPVWLNFIDTLYVPDFTGLDGNAPTFLASRFRWSLTAGTHGHIYGYAL